MAKAVTVVFSGIPIALTRKKIKSYRLRISRSTGAVSLSVPLSATEASIRSVVEGRMDWIRAHLGAPIPARRYESGERVRYFGECRPLLVREGDRREAFLGEGGEVVLICRPGDGADRRREILHSFYKTEVMRRAEEVLPTLIARSGYTPASLRVGSARSRWGSCKTPDNAVTLSLYLAEHPLPCLAFVLMHELVHIRWHGHGKRFYDTLTRLMPDWRDRRDLLRTSAAEARRDWMPDGEETV